MTSQALLVLFLAHVCSIIGTASQQAADHDNKLDTATNMRTYNGAHNINLWTNLHTNLDESNSELYKNKKYDEIYEEDKEVKIDKHRNKLYNEIYKEDKDVKINEHRNRKMYDEIYEDDKDVKINKHRNLKFYEKPNIDFDERKIIGKKRYKREDNRCEQFRNIDGIITHPHASTNKTYYSKSNCVTVVEAGKDQVIELTFVDEFHIEDHADCAYDYLEIRDGKKGYAKLLGKVCGTAFPAKQTTSGPYAWLKFRSDDTIEYDGFKIIVTFKNTKSYTVPESCYINLNGKYGDLKLSKIPQCIKESQNLDILWTIETPENMKIYLNFTTFKLATPNECETNLVEVFGAAPESDHRLAQYCGSIANPVSTKDSDEKGNTNEKGNTMYVRVYIAETAKKETQFEASFTAYRTLNPNLADTEKCNEDEFDCRDNTCIDLKLMCDTFANCRLKTDEDSEICKPAASSTISQPHILVILIIFSLILSAMCFVFLFKCIRKLYQDHKIIKEHIRESCEDRLDIVGSRLILDAKRLQRDSEPRASLERENQANEMFKRKRESFSKRKPTSIDSDYIQETHLDIDEEPWRREVDSVPDEEVRIERNGRTRRSERERQDRRIERAIERQSERRSDMSKKEESIRSKRESEEREKKEIKDVSVGTPDTKDSGCQTRESLFQADAPPSSNGSGTTGTNSRGFSTFGYSGATIARPSPPAINTSEITIELLRQVPKQDSIKQQKKMADRRPISTETTRSAPDVIIVSKPIR